MRFGFREIQEIKREEKNLHCDPDKLIDPVDAIVQQAQTNADRVWEKYVERTEKAYDPDKLIEVS